jgi:aspartate aminotransferase-like enzyme
MPTDSSFPVLTANLDLRGELFQANKNSWVPVLKRFEEALKQVSAEGNEVSLKRHQTRGQLLRKYIDVCPLWMI